jgi:hypothetical protein
MNALLKLLPQPTTEQTAKRAINALAALGVERSKITYDPDEFQLRTDGTAPGWGTCTPIAGWSGPRKGGDNDQAENQGVGARRGLEDRHPPLRLAEGPGLHPATLPGRELPDISSVGCDESRSRVVRLNRARVYPARENEDRPSSPATPACRLSRSGLAIIELPLEAAEATWRT